MAVTKNRNNENIFLFNEFERQEMIEESTKHFKNIEVKIFDSLLVEFVKSVDSRIVIRGLRVLSDFEYEFKMALMNRKLDETITTLFMMPHEKYTHVSSSLIKEVALLGGDIRDYVSDFVFKKINDKINEN